MSTEPGDLSGQLPAVLRGGPTPAAPAPAAAPPNVVELLPAAATSRHQQVVTAALAGTPTVVRTGTEGGPLLAGLLAALAAAGRRVAVLPGSNTDAARTELATLGLAHLLDDAEEDPTRRGADLPAADAMRWRSVFTDLTDRHRSWFGGTADTPSRFEALSGLAALRAEHLHPPLVPGAERWTAADRARITGLLSAAPGGGPDPLQDVSDEDVDAAADTLEALPVQLTRLSDLLARLAADLGWAAPATLSQAEEVPAILGRVDEALRRYVPAALRTDLDQARAVLARQPRSLLSAEERERRRELKRLSGLRLDGGSFGPDDVEALARVQREWTAHAGGAPAGWPARGDLQAVLETLRRSLSRVRTVLPEVPAEPGELALGDLPALSGRARAVSEAAHARRTRADVATEGLDDLVQALPAGSGPAEVARFVDGAHWRALAEAAPGAAEGTRPFDDVVGEFRRLDDLRRARAARELQLALSGARAQRVHVGEPSAPVDVLVVDDADRLPAARVADLAGEAVLVLLGDPGDGTGDGTGGDPGSAWARAATVVTPVVLTEPGTPSPLRDVVATAVRTAGLDVAPDTTGGLVVSEGPGPALIVDLDASWTTIPLQDREIARPARLRSDPQPRHLLRTAVWFADPRAAVRDVVAAVRALADLPGATPVVTAPPPAPVETFPKGLGAAEDAQRAVTEFVAALAGGNPNIDQTPPATIDAAIALTYADLGVTATDTAVLDAAMDLLTYRRRGTKVLRAFKESLERTRKRMRGAGVKLP